MDSAFRGEIPPVDLMKVHALAASWTKRRPWSRVIRKVEPMAKIRNAFDRIKLGLKGVDFGFFKPVALYLLIYCLGYLIVMNSTLRRHTEMLAETIEAIRGGRCQCEAALDDDRIVVEELEDSKGDFRDLSSS